MQDFVYAVRVINSDLDLFYKVQSRVMDAMLINRRLPCFIVCMYPRLIQPVKTPISTPDTSENFSRVIIGTKTGVVVMSRFVFGSVIINPNVK